MLDPESSSHVEAGSTAPNVLNTACGEKHMVPEDNRNAGLSQSTAEPSSPSEGVQQERRAGEVTQILSAIEQGDARAAEQLFPLVYDQLRKLAAIKLSRERPGQTLQATALVHEAYLRLVDVDKAQQWDSRGHFFSAAAEAMRRILIDKARRKTRAKHGGQWERVEFDCAALQTHMKAEELVELDGALTEFQRVDPLKAQLVTLRYFAGMTTEQAAEILGISRVTAHRYWTYARAWLRDRMTAGADLPHLREKK